MTYYNTTHATGAELRAYQQQAMSQEDVILDWFQHHSVATPSEVQQAVLPTAPLTSVRRAITNLTNAGQLTKTTIQRPGPYGRPEYAWKSVPVQREMF